MLDTPIGCETYQEDLSALIDGELSSEREAELRGHLGACTGCSQRLEEFRGVNQALAGVALPEVPVGLRARLQQRIQSIPEREGVARTRPVPARGRRRFVGPAVGAALAVAASVAVYLAVAPKPASNPSPDERLVAVDRDPGADAISVEEPAVAEAKVAMDPETRVEEGSSEESVGLEETVAVVEDASELEVARVEEPAVAGEIELVIDRGLAVEEEPIGEFAGSEQTVAVVEDASELDAATVEELAMALDFETIWDLDVIENLEMLERMMAVEEGAG